MNELQNIAIFIKVNFKTKFKVSIFVGNLPFRAERDDVLRLFLPFGEVTNCSLPLERDTGRKRGFAFVEMASESLESAAIEGLQGSEMMGRPLRINKAEPRGNTPRKNYGYGNPRNGNNGYESGGNSGYGSGGNSGGYNRYGSNSNTSSYTDQNFNTSNRSSGAKGWEDRSFGNNNSENSDYENGRSRRRRGGTNNIEEQISDQQNNQ